MMGYLFVPTLTVHVPTLSISPPGSSPINVDKISPPQSPIDTEELPPPIPPQQFSDEDILLLPKLSENVELQQDGRNTTPPFPPKQDATIPQPSPKVNKEDTTVPPLPPKTNKKEGDLQPPSPEVNQEDTTVPPLPPKTNEEDSTLASCSSTANQEHMTLYTTTVRSICIEILLWICWG